MRLKPDPSKGVAWGRERMSGVAFGLIAPGPMIRSIALPAGKVPPVQSTTGGTTGASCNTDHTGNGGEPGVCRHATYYSTE